MRIEISELRVEAHLVRGEVRLSHGEIAKPQAMVDSERSREMCKGQASRDTAGRTQQWHPTRRGRRG